MECNENKKTKQLFERCISSGLNFLHKNQLPHGEFKTYISPDIKMEENYRYVSTTYITSFIIYSLSFVKSRFVKDMTNKSLNFFIEEMEFPGIWRYFGVNRNVKLSGGKISEYTPIGVVPDLDDTACISYCLKKNNISFYDNLEVFLNNRNENGLFYTWLMDYPKRKEYSEEIVYLFPKSNDICCGVNSNILLYLGQNENTNIVCEYINDIISNDLEENNIPYFPGRLALYYILSRAYFNRIHSLKKSRDLILNKIIPMQLEDGSFGSVLSTAFAVCTFINFNFLNDSIQKALEFIITKQRKDGSWLRERFCDGGIYYYGSEELTTAICLEALSRFKEKIDNEKGA